MEDTDRLITCFDFMVRIASIRTDAGFMDSLTVGKTTLTFIQVN